MYSSPAITPILQPKKLRQSNFRICALNHCGSEEDPDTSFLVRVSSHCPPVSARPFLSRWGREQSVGRWCGDSAWQGVSRLQESLRRWILGSSC